MQARRRNQSDSHSPTGPSCDYDTAIGFSSAVAIAGTDAMSVEPQFSSFMLAQAAHVTVVDTTDAETNRRAKLNTVATNACNLESYSVAAGATGGRIAPDEFQGGLANCLGTPVCWGWFGKAAQNQDLVLTWENISAASAIDIYVSVYGRGSSAAPVGIGQRCSAPLPAM